MRGGATAARLLRIGAVISSCQMPVAGAGLALAQATSAAARDSARADSVRRAAPAGLIPAGFGSLRRDDVALKVQSLGLVVTAVPLEESVIRTLSPDTYKSLHALRDSKARQLDSIRTRMGLPAVQAWYVEFFNVQQGEARFDPLDFVVRSAGRDYRPLQLFPLKPGFGDGRLAQREMRNAIYAFDPQVDLSQPLTVTIGTLENAAWGDVLPRLELERSLIWSRAAAHKP